MSKFQYSLDNKRYHTLNYYNRMRYGGKVYKASLDAGMTCPNRDGTRGTGGCIYCQGLSHYFAGAGSLRAQLDAELERIHQKHPEAQVIAYFQAGTNTYAPVEKLNALWDAALELPEVVGISVATRADCLGAEILEALSRLNTRTDLTVELGLQTVFDETAVAIGRGHSFSEFLEGYEALRQRGIRTCVHLIDGLPGETRDMMLESARVLGKLRPGGVKLHLLHVAEGTGLAEMWRQGDYSPMEKADYVSVVSRQLMYFPPETVIERLTGDGDKNLLLAPLWSRDKISVLGAIDKYMETEDLIQGQAFSE